MGYGYADTDWLRVRLNLRGRLRLSYSSYSRNPNVVYDNLHCARSTTHVIQLNSDDRDKKNLCK